MKDRMFEVLQRVGRSFMLPIAILPVAGLFLGIGGSFTNETMPVSYTHLKHTVDAVKHRRHEQKRKFQRLCDAGEHGCQRRGQQKPSGLFSFARISTAVHGQRCPRQSEDHQRKFS